MTLPQIAASWAMLQRATSDVQSLVLRRIAICDACPRKKQLTSAGIESKGENLADSVYYCGSCGCSLWSKLHDDENVCPEGYWQAEVSLY